DLVSSRDRTTGSSSQLWLWARSAKFTIIAYYPPPQWVEKQTVLPPSTRGNRGPTGFGQISLCLPIVERGQRAQSRAQVFAQRARAIAPFPVAANAAGKIHAGFGAEAQHILQRNDGDVGY